MSQYIVTVLDTTGIQPYIFGSNRLRENIGASYLVARATDDWAKEALGELAGQLKREVYIPNPETPAAKPHIEDGQLAAELVYAGGGNTIVLFEKMDYAKQFTRILSKRVLEEAPGINIVVAHKEFDWNQELLSKVIQNLIDVELDRNKRGRIPSSPLLGLGVTADCTSTRLVAVDTSDRHQVRSTYLVSSEIVAKLDAVEAANTQLKEKVFEPKVPNKYKIPLDFDDFGRSKHESSYIAVVHADGNSMGDRFKKHGACQSSNRDYITAMRELSHSVNQAGLTALKAVAKAVVDSIDSEGKVMSRFPIKDKFVPFRPLVYGGDDVTFVCDGRLGLELASLYLKSFAQQTVADGECVTACAGICIVKAHYPFARAYELSEQLCSNAKIFLRQQKEELGFEQNFSALDWHVTASGILGAIGEIRQREYKVAEGSLTMRPVRLEDEDNQWRTWSNFTNIVTAFNEDEAWKDRRNKVIALRDILRQGQQATSQFIKAYGLKSLPFVKEAADELHTTGWTESHCGYFDAIEAMEFYLSLKKEESNEHLPIKN